MLYIVYAYFLFKIKNFYKKKEPIPSGMSPSKESDSFLSYFTFIPLNIFSRSEPSPPKRKRYGRGFPSNQAKDVTNARSA